jgi:hypothetical protein
MPQCPSYSRRLFAWLRCPSGRLLLVIPEVGLSTFWWCAARRWFIRMEVEDLHCLAVVAAG